MLFLLISFSFFLLISTWNWTIRFECKKTKIPLSFNWFTFFFRNLFHFFFSLSASSPSPPLNWNCIFNFLPILFPSSSPFLCLFAFEPIPFPSSSPDLKPICVWNPSLHLPQIWNPSPSLQLPPLHLQFMAKPDLIPRDRGGYINRFYPKPTVNRF